MKLRKINIFLMTWTRIKYSIEINEENSLFIKIVNETIEEKMK